MKPRYSGVDERRSNDVGRTFFGERDDEIAQELPTMRAVAMMSSGPSLVESRVTTDYGGKPSLGIPRPSFGLKRLPQSQSKSFEVTKEWSGVAPAKGWNVKGEDLELVPVDYPLERTHREIMDTDASVVASRISAALASMSIETEFDCKNAKAKCKTGDYVGFRIRLYAGNESGQPVVVEMQRRCGSASSFMSTCRAILLAAEGKDASLQPQGRVPPFKKQPVGELRCLQHAMDKNRNFENEARVALDDVVNMLRSDQLDSNLLGIENLVSLTDPIKTSPSVSLLVSKSILLGDDKYDMREEIRILTERDFFATGAADHSRGMTARLDQLRHHALIVFANALNMCANDGCLEGAIKEHPWFKEYLVPSLCDELRRVASNACNAYQASCCLSSLLSCSEQVRQLLRQQSGVELLKESNAFGLARHALLANETERCLKYLESFP